MCDLEWPLSEIQEGHWFLKCSKNDEIQLSNDPDAMYSEWVGALSLLGLRVLRPCFTYLLSDTVGLWHIKPEISSKRLKIERKRLLTAYTKSYTGFRFNRLPPKCMTLNDLWARFKVINSLNAAKMTKYSIVITPTPCSVWRHYLY